MSRKIQISQFRSAYDHQLVTFIDYDSSASKREKRKALQELRQMPGAEAYIREKRPGVYQELLDTES